MVMKATADEPAADEPEPEPEVVASDAALMVDLAGGDLKALGELYLRHGETVASFLARVLPFSLQGDVEDLCHDVFLDIKNLSQRYEERGSLRSWLIGVAIRKARNFRRKQKIHSILLRRNSSGGSTKRPPPDTSGAMTDCLDVQRAMEKMPQGYREVLVLNVVMGFTAEEISTALDIRPGSVWARLHRARKKLMAVLDAPLTVGEER